MVFFSSKIHKEPNGKVVHEVCRESLHPYFKPAKETASVQTLPILKFNMSFIIFSV